MKDRILRGIAKWGAVAVIAVVVVAAFLAPMAVIRESNAQTERILMRLEERQNEDRENAIRVNVLTIGCLLLIEPEHRTPDDLELCIREGFEQFD